MVVGAALTALAAPLRNGVVEGPGIEAEIEVEVEDRGVWAILIEAEVEVGRFTMAGRTWRMVTREVRGWEVAILEVTVREVEEWEVEIIEEVTWERIEEEAEEGNQEA